jgi:uncharacterized protein YjlB
MALPQVENRNSQHDSDHHAIVGAHKSGQQNDSRYEEDRENEERQQKTRESKDLPATAHDTGNHHN